MALSGLFLDTRRCRAATGTGTAADDEVEVVDALAVGSIAQMDSLLAVDGDVAGPAEDDASEAGPALSPAPAATRRSRFVDWIPSYKGMPFLRERLPV